MKSLLLASTILALAACSKPVETVEKPPFQQPSSSRYELVQLGTMRRDQYLLDKQTGQIWVPTCFVVPKKGSSADCDYSAWMKADIEEINMTRAAIYDWAKTANGGK